MGSMLKGWHRSQEEEKATLSRKESILQGDGQVPEQGEKDLQD